MKMLERLLEPSLQVDPFLNYLPIRKHTRLVKNGIPLLRLLNRAQTKQAMMSVIILFGEILWDSDSLLVV